MKNEKLDKAILCNENLDAPSAHVLDAAKTEMQKNRPVRKKLSPQKIWAIAATCAAVLVVLCCIPLMLPKETQSSYSNSAKFPSTAGMTQFEIDSIEDFNNQTGESILTFDNAVINESNLYQSSSGDKYCRELYTYGDTQIEMWVGLFTYGELMGSEGTDPQYKIDSVNGCTIRYVTSDDNRVYAKFQYKNYTYMIEMTGETSSWKNILENFIK